MALLKTPDASKQIVAIAAHFSLNEAQLKQIFSGTFDKWKEYTSQEEFFSLLVFGHGFFKKLYAETELDDDGIYIVLDKSLQTIADTLNNDSKLLNLNQIGITGICDLDKANTELKKGIVADIFGSREPLDFLFALSDDQTLPKSIFIEALEFAAALPID